MQQRNGKRRGRNKQQVTYYRNGNRVCEGKGCEGSGWVCDGSNQRLNAQISNNWFSFGLSVTIGLLVMVGLSAIAGYWQHLGSFGLTAPIGLSVMVGLSATVEFVWVHHKHQR